MALPKPGLYSLAFVPSDSRCAKGSVMIYATAAEAPLDQLRLVVFGDSLSDDGTGLASLAGDAFLDLNPAPYTGGRASNGPTWVEYLTDTLLNNTVRLNYAV